MIGKKLWPKTMAKNPKVTQPVGTSNLQRRARFYAKVISLLFSQQNLSGATLVKANRAARHLSLGVRLNDATELNRALKLIEPMALAANCSNVLAQRQAGLVVFQFQLPSGFWQSYTRDDLPIVKAIGLAEQRRPVAFSLEDAPHALIAGTTGSGKSETVKSVLIAQLSSHKTNELGLVIIDPDGDYDDFHNVAHLLTPIAQEPEMFEKVLTWLNQELVRRKAANIKEGKPILIVIDEVQDVLANEHNQVVVQQLSQQGRKYRLHLVAATQKPSHTDLPKILDNLLNRFVGQVTDGKVSANITGHAGLAAHQLTGEGDFLHVVGAKVERFQVAMATRADFERLERGETRPLVVDPVELIELPPELPERRPGRPSLELSPEWLAYYFYRNPNKISRSMAKELGLTRSFHELHQDFCKQFIAEYLKFRQGIRR